MNTDEAWEGNMRSSTMLTRYHVGADSVGLIDTFPKKADAFDCAIRWARRSNETAWVFDSLARMRAPQLWEVPPGVEESRLLQPTKRKGT